MKNKNKEFIEKLKTLQFNTKKSKPESELCGTVNSGPENTMACDNCGAEWKVLETKKVMDTPIGPLVRATVSMNKPPHWRN